MADLKENQMTQATPNLLRGIDSNGNSILATIQSVTKYCFTDKGITTSIENFDFNNAETGVYAVNEADCLNQPYNDIGTLISFNAAYKLQIFMSLRDGSQIFIRASDIGNNWKPWRKIQSSSI